MSFQLCNSLWRGDQVDEFSAVRRNNMTNGSGQILAPIITGLLAHYVVTACDAGSIGTTIGGPQKLAGGGEASVVPEYRLTRVAASTD